MIRPKSPAEKSMKSGSSVLKPSKQGIAGFLKKLNDNQFALIDPVSNKVLVNDRVPDYITSSDFYNNSIERLKKYAPTVDIQIMFGSHLSAKVMLQGGDLDRCVKSADLFIPEYAFWDNKTCDLLNEISASDVKIKYNKFNRSSHTQHDPDSSFRAYIQAISASQTIIDFHDISKYDYKYIPGLASFIKSRDLTTGMNYYDRYLCNSVLDNLREWIMIARLGDAISYNLRLSHKGHKRFSVLIFNGLMHRTLLDKLKLLGVQPIKVIYHAPELSKLDITAQKHAAAIKTKYVFGYDDMLEYRKLITTSAVRILKQQSASDSATSLTLK
jgi:hypothetical protein